MREDAAKDDDDDKDVKGQAEDDPGDGQEAGIDSVQNGVLKQGRDGEEEADQKQTSPEADRIDAQDDDCRAHESEEVVAGASVIGVGIENQAGEQEEEKKEKLSRGDFVPVRGLEQIQTLSFQHLGSAECCR
jgi:hypothetical protein